MAVSFSKNWGDEVSAVTDSVEFQTCEISVTWAPEVVYAYDYRTGETWGSQKVVSKAALLVNTAYAALQADPADQALIDVYDDAVASLLQTAGIAGAPDVFVSDAVPHGSTGDVWVRVVDGVGLVSVFDGAWGLLPVTTVLYEGRARFIPVRASVQLGGEAQLNATSIRAVRFQVPRSAAGVRFHAGAVVTFTAAAFNLNLVGRTAKVSDDFQGATTASRTVHAMMDADSEDG